LYNGNSKAEVLDYLSTIVSPTETVRAQRAKAYPSAVKRCDSTRRRGFRFSCGCTCAERSRMGASAHLPGATREDL